MYRRSLNIWIRFLKVIFFESWFSLSRNSPKENWCVKPSSIDLGVWNPRSDLTLVLFKPSNYSTDPSQMSNFSSNSTTILTASIPHHLMVETLSHASSHNPGMYINARHIAPPPSGSKHVSDIVVLFFMLFISLYVFFWVV